MVAFGLMCLVPICEAAERTPEELLRWVVARYERAEGVTWYEPAMDYISVVDFTAFPAIIKDDGGRTRLVLRAIRTSEEGVGVRQPIVGPHVESSRSPALAPASA